MAQLLKSLQEKNLISPPSFLVDGTVYLTYMGSVAYGVQREGSDLDVYGVCVPPLDILYPSTYGGHIEGFTNDDKQVFNQWQETGIGYKKYDFNIYNIAKYFLLCMNGNPNMVDSLFTPVNCIIHCDAIGKHIRDYRKIFLSKKMWHTFKGYAYSQMSKIHNGMNKNNPVRSADIEKWGYDLKFAYHLVRLLNEVEMILTDYDLDLQRNNEQLKSIRRGEWKLEDVEKYFRNKEAELEQVYHYSVIPHAPDMKDIKRVLIQCIDMFHDKQKQYNIPDRAVARKDSLIEEVIKAVERYNNG